MGSMRACASMKPGRIVFPAQSICLAPAGMISADGADQVAFHQYRAVSSITSVPLRIVVINPHA